jgi:hypothetical protein
MATPVQQKFRDKKRTPQQIPDIVKTGQWIQPGVEGGDSAVPMKELARRLGAAPPEYRTVALCQLLPDYELQFAIWFIALQPFFIEKLGQTA